MRTVILSSLFLVLASFSAQANGDFCVTGLKGTATNAFVFRVSSPNNADRSLTLLDNNKNTIFVSKIENRFTQFNSSGYGVCSLTASGVDEQTGAHYKAELKVTPHSKATCNQFQIPTSVEYITLKVVPKGTTLGDDITAYALTIIPCP